MSAKIWLRQIGNPGNCALQFLAGSYLQNLLPNSMLENARLPTWGHVSESPPPDAIEHSVHIREESLWFDADGVADCVKRQLVNTVILDGFPYHLANFPSRAASRQLLDFTQGGGDAAGFGANQLVCSVRADEILHNVHPNYIPLPPEYYTKLAKHSGLELVFFGQIGDDPYCNSLRQAFPSAPFVPGRNPAYDFDMLRRSVNIAPSISTFAWLAAWLSEAKRIYLPVGGIFHPVYQPYQMFLPLQDECYEFVLLPHIPAVNLYEAPEAFAQAQAIIGRLARFIGRDELRRLCAQAETMFMRRPYLAGFDAEYYARRYPDVAAAVAGGGLRSALDHYLNYGFQEYRQPLEIDPLFYTGEYPDAADAIACGLYSGPLHHYQAVGYKKGYRPVKPG